MVPKSRPQEGKSLGSLLRAVTEALTDEVYRGLAERGFPDLRPAHGAVFRNVPPMGARATDLAARAGMKKQSMGYLVDDLQASGYVEEIPDPRDGRARLVCLTSRGIDAQESLTRLSREWESRWAERVGSKDWETTRRTLERLVAEIEAGS